MKTPEPARDSAPDQSVPDSETFDIPENPVPAELTPEELEQGYEFENGEVRAVDLSDGRVLVLQLGDVDNQVLLGCRVENAKAWPVQDAPAGRPFVYFGRPDEPAEPTVEIPTTHPLPLGRYYQPGRFTELASRAHTLIQRRGGVVVIEDLSSKNGTLIRYKD